MKNLLAVVLTIIVIFSLTTTVFAHSGGTDYKGGHNGPGGYHYHHGYPAHQHENGICPYGYNTNYNDSIDKDSARDTIIICLISFFISQILYLISISKRFAPKPPNKSNMAGCFSYVFGLPLLPLWFLCVLLWNKLREKHEEKKWQRTDSLREKESPKPNDNTQPPCIDLPSAKKKQSPKKATTPPEPLKCNHEIEERNKQYWADMARIIGSVLNSETENKKDKAFEVAKEKILDIPCSDTVRLDGSDHSEIFARLYEIYNKVREKNTFKKCLGTKSEFLGKYIADYKDHLEHIRLLTVVTYLKENE